MARPKGNKWLADYIVDGQRRRTVHATRAEAEMHEREPDTSARQAQDPCIGEAFPAWGQELWRGTRNEKHVYSRVKLLVEDLGFSKKVKLISREDIAGLRKLWSDRGNSPGTMNAKLACLSRLLTYAVEDAGIMDTRPLTKFAKLRAGRVRSLSPAEEMAIFAGLPEPHDRLAVFLLHTGCRVGEASKLLWKDVNYDESSGQVTFWDTKNGSSRSVPLTRQAHAALLPSLSLKWAGPFTQIAYHQFIKKWHKAVTAVGLGEDRQVVPHILRHTCATRLGQANVSPIHMMKWMGHSNLEMTKRYTHLGTNDLKDAANVLERSSF